jgi:hypothetical protein
MTIDDLRTRLMEMSEMMDREVEGVRTSAETTQAKIYDLLQEEIKSFQLNDGRFVLGQSYAEKFALIERKIKSLLGEYYVPSIKEYLGSYSTVEQTNISLQQSYNEIEVKKSLLTPARRTVYNQAEYYLVEGLADAYVQPAKFILMQQVTTGGTLKDAESLLRNWNDGELPAGKMIVPRQAPRLQAYATQIARDSIYSYQGSIQEIIKQEYKLERFIYVGDIIKDSRPFCRHLVGLKRKIHIDEVPKFVEQFPEGLRPDTTKKNFYINRGGYSCRHTVMAVR